MAYISEDLFISYFFTAGREASASVVGVRNTKCYSLLQALARPWKSRESLQSLKMADEF